MASKSAHQRHHQRIRDSLASPIVAAIKNFDLAKRLHKENLEHQPLPDTITDSMYRKLQMQRAREPGLALKDGNYASGVAWKAYAGYGPTRCTKLRVFRPKTSIMHKIKDSANDRPSSVNSFDRKWRFIRQRKVLPIQLAVCWDLTPVNPTDEPKRPIHIDGSNGSSAPAVFTLVHSPQNGAPPDPLRDSELAQVEPKCDGLHDTSVSPENLRPKTSHLHVAQKEIAEERKFYSPVCGSVQSQMLHNSPDLNCSENLYCGKECFSTQGRQRQHPCVACELKNVQIKDVTRPKSDYKMAFKAGVPQKNFKRQDYPEHWRLATVYQHSYKPMQARKRPMLQTVFK